MVALVVPFPQNGYYFVLYNDYRYCGFTFFIGLSSRYAFVSHLLFGIAPVSRSSLPLLRLYLLHRTVLPLCFRFAFAVRDRSLQPEFVAATAAVPFSLDCPPAMLSFRICCSGSLPSAGVRCRYCGCTFFIGLSSRYAFVLHCCSGSLPSAGVLSSYVSS